jgi:hypothetical protein
LSCRRKPCGRGAVWARSGGHRAMTTRAHAACGCRMAGHAPPPDSTTARHWASCSPKCGRVGRAGAVWRPVVARWQRACLLATRSGRAAPQRGQGGPAPPRHHSRSTQGATSARMLPLLMPAHAWWRRAARLRRAPACVVCCALGGKRRPPPTLRNQSSLLPPTMFTTLQRSMRPLFCEARGRPGAVRAVDRTSAPCEGGVNSTLLCALRNACWGRSGAHSLK